LYLDCIVTAKRPPSRSERPRRERERRFAALEAVTQRWRFPALEIFSLSLGAGPEPPAAKRNGDG
jgi:hypothetical protein